MSTALFIPPCFRRSSAIRLVVKPPLSASWQSRFAQQFPGDSGSEHESRQTPGVIYSWVKPTPVTAPLLAIHSPEAAALLGLKNPETAPEKKEWTAVFSGNQLAPGMRPYAARYGGYQFGHWAGQLGDGRAITLGELQGADQQTHEVQLKGAGLTPYSRQGDGRAVLRSSLREFLCSEAMHHLGIPTTRALALVLTGERVIRDMFYDGHPAAEPGAICTRVAPSFLRIGNLEILAAHQEKELLQKLADYVRTTYYPEANTLAEFFHAVCLRTAKLMVQWTRVGFVHGVMNTDNLSLLGLTIDYGPYGWLDEFDPNFTPNTTDAKHGRYRFSNQPLIAQWNLERMAESLLPLGVPEQDLASGLTAYHQTFRESYLEMMASKLGLSKLTSVDLPLLDSLQKLFQETPIDHTLFFRALANPSTEISAQLDATYYAPASTHSEATQRIIQNWIRDYADRRSQEAQSLPLIFESMNQTNPAFILRNYLTHQAAQDLEKGDSTLMMQLFAALRSPYDGDSIPQELQKRRPDWAKTMPGCAKLSCSS